MFCVANSKHCIFQHTLMTEFKSDFIFYQFLMTNAFYFKQSVNITNWINIPNKSTFFPLRLQHEKIPLDKQTIWVLLEANFLKSGISEEQIICEVCIIEFYRQYLCCTFVQ